MSNPFTCNTCSLQFPTAEDQRSHMKSEWHRYNLKRRVANLPAIDEALFNDKVSKLSINKDGEDEKDDKKTSTKQVTKKEQRRREKEELLEKKRQLLELARQNMMNSSRLCDDNGNRIVREVKQTEFVASEPAEIVVEEEEEAKEPELTEEQELEKIMEEKIKNKVDIPLENCLFCNKAFANLDENIDHMFKNHGFYIPEQKFLVNKEGLVQYMSEKIGVGNLCIVCSFQGRSLESARAHMLSKRHCQIPYHTEDEKLEISEFYDFTSTYASIDATTNEEDWEDEGELVDSDEEEDQDLPQQISYNDGVELHLPSGIKIGNRALARYYRQNLRPETVLSEGQGTIIAAESRHLASVQDKKQLMETKRIWKTEKSHQDRDDRRAAKFINNQPHYRDQLLQ